MDENQMFYLQVYSLLAVLVLYSVMEYIIHKIHHPETTKFTSFLITKDYVLAYTFGYIEFFIGRYFWPHFKSNPQSIEIYFGYLMEFVGLFIRFDGILTAGKSFTHQIKLQKAPEHKLITHGIYKYIRHPGYLGFFIFAVGTQIALRNFVSVIGFIIVLWNFFSKRIYVEEKALSEMFGDDYKAYKNKTKTWIPFIE